MMQQQAARTTTKPLAPARAEANARLLAELENARERNAAREIDREHPQRAAAPQISAMAKPTQKKERKRRVRDVRTNSDAPKGKRAFVPIDEAFASQVMSMSTAPRCVQSTDSTLRHAECTNVGIHSSSVAVLSVASAASTIPLATSAKSSPRQATGPTLSSLLRKTEPPRSVDPPPLWPPYPNTLDGCIMEMIREMEYRRIYGGEIDALNVEQQAETGGVAIPRRQYHWKMLSADVRLEDGASEDMNEKPTASPPTMPVDVRVASGDGEAASTVVSQLSPELTHNRSSQVSSSQGSVDSCSLRRVAPHSVHIGRLFPGDLAESDTDEPIEAEEPDGGDVEPDVEPDMVSDDVLALSLEAPPSEATEASQSSLPDPANRRYLKARWPPLVVPLGDHYNPFDVRLPAGPDFGDCDCASECRVETCRNARMSVYCVRGSCPYQGECGNGLRERPGVELVRIDGTQHFCVIATQYIPAGFVLGQYFGVIRRERRLTGKEMAEQAEQQGGYKLVIGKPAVSKSKWWVSIDVRSFGSKMRFVNHSCDPVAVFRQVYNRRRHIVVVSTVRPLRLGDEVTVKYGKYLWLRCRCGLQIAATPI